MHLVVAWGKPYLKLALKEGRAMCFIPRPNQRGRREQTGSKPNTVDSGFLLDRARITVLCLKPKPWLQIQPWQKVEHSAGCRHYLDRTRTQYLRNTVVIKLDGARSTVLQPNTVVTLTVQEHGIKNQIYQPWRREEHGIWTRCRGGACASWWCTRGSPPRR